MMKMEGVWRVALMRNLRCLAQDLEEGYFVADNPSPQSELEGQREG